MKKRELAQLKKRSIERAKQIDRLRVWIDSREKKSPVRKTSVIPDGA